MLSLEMACPLREECGKGWMESEQTRLIDRYLELSAQGPGKVEAYISGLIKPRNNNRVRLIDDNSGECLGIADILNVLTQDMVGAGAAGGKGDRDFNNEIERQNELLRRHATTRPLDQTTDPFTTEQVNKM